MRVGWYAAEAEGIMTQRECEEAAAQVCGQGIPSIEAGRPVPETFAVGDVVWLKSGGPPMTVVEADSMIFTAQFLANGEVDTWEWPPACLTHTKPEESA